MPTKQLGSVLRHLQILAGDPKGADRPDGELLHAFRARNDQAAFETLVRRHGSMVLQVGQRILGSLHDAEDVFQATFLVLAQQSASIRKQESLASWLHGVAHRMATNARRALTRRRKHEERARTRRPAAPPSRAALREVQAILDEEILALPEIYREPFVLCCLEHKSCAEVASRLGRKEGTIWNRLARARAVLQERLSRRGVSLVAAVAAAALGADGASGAIPPNLLGSTVNAAAHVVAGHALRSGVVSVAVVALVQGVNRSMSLRNLKTVILLAVTATVLGAGLGLTLLQRAGAQQRLTNPPEPARAEGKPAPAEPKPNASVEVRGRVLGPDGKPFAGAEVILATDSWQEGGKGKPAVRAMSDADGRFHFTANRRELTEGSNLVATARDCGMDWVKAAGADGGEVTLKLVKDVPIAGRVLDLEGRPVAGVAVHVDRIQTTPAEDLTPGFKAWQKEMQIALGVLSKQFYQPDWVGSILPSVKTDAEGRFKITGVGRERMAVLKLIGDTIEHKTLYVFCRPGTDVTALTRPDPEQKMPGVPQRSSATVYGPTFDHPALPTKPIVGVVRDKATGKPVANVGINGNAANHHWSDYANTKTDAEGRFKLLGVAKAHDYSISAYAGGGKTYLPAMKQVGDTDGLKPVTVEFELVRGVLLKGRVTDKSNGKPVESALFYHPLADNKFFRDLPGNDWYRSVSQGHRTEKDGTFSILALPGSGVLLVRAEGEAGKLYTAAVIAPADKAKAYRDEDEEGSLGGSFLSAGGTIEHLHGYHAYRLIEPDKDAETLECKVELDRGISVSARVLAPDGKPLEGASAGGLAAWGDVESLKGAEFTVRALTSSRPRLVVLVHRERKLAGHVLVHGNEKEPVQVKLEPWAAMAGRVLDEEGNPLAEAEVRISYQDDAARWLFELGREKDRTDPKGRFRAEGLIPGIPFGISFVKKGIIHDPGDIYRKLSPGSGKTHEVGDVKTKIYRLGD